jgi:chromosome segregation protein
VNTHEKMLTSLTEELTQKQKDYKKLLTLKQEPKQQVEVLRTKIQHHEQQILQKNYFIERSTQELSQLTAQLKLFNHSDVKKEAELSTKNLQGLMLELDNIDRVLDAKQAIRLELEHSVITAQEHRHHCNKELTSVKQSVQTRMAHKAAWLEVQDCHVYEIFQQQLPKQGYQEALSMAFSTEFLFHGEKPPTRTQLEMCADKDIEYTWASKEVFFAFEEKISLPAYCNQWVYCDSYEQALVALKDLTAQEVLLLPNGALLGKNWIRPSRNRPQITIASLLNREKELTVTFELLVATHQEKQQQLIRIKDELVHFQMKKKELQENIKEVTKNQQNLNLKAERLYQQYIAVTDKIQTIEQQRKESEKQQLLFNNEILAFRSKVEELMVLIETQETSCDALDETLSKLQQAHQETTIKLKLAQEKNNQASEALQQWKIKLVSSKTQEESLKTQRHLCEKELVIKQEELQRVQDPIPHYLVLLNQAEHEFDTMQLKLTEVLEALKIAQNDLRSIISTERQQEQLLAQILNKLHHQELLHEKNTAELSYLVEQILDFGWDVDQIQLIHTTELLPDLKKKISELQEQLESMGQINLRAIEEHQKEQERLTFINEQYLDVHQAAQNLLQGIQELDEEIKQLFDTTFNQLNNSFETLFPILFGGGYAQLVRVSVDDDGDFGVIIKAQPPGKKNSTLSVLSGGEKALTAAALVFSFFNLNPAPFCLLDEVDAPLDDTNTLRLGAMIKKLSETIQFIIVTHSKIMMEQGDILYGVTMKEPGVSRLVNVDMKAALEIMV